MRPWLEPCEAADTKPYASRVSALFTACAFALVEAGRHPSQSTAPWLDTLAVPCLWVPIGILAASVTGRVKRLKATRKQIAR